MLASSGDATPPCGVPASVGSNTSPVNTPAFSQPVITSRKTGTWLKEGVVSPTTKGSGSVWDVAFSSDPQQRFVYVADGHDQKVFILRRDTLRTVGSFGDGGRYPGTFYSVGSVAVDSKGNVYTGETLEGKRVQKFVLKTAGR